MVGGNRETLLAQAEKRELTGKLRRLIFKEERGWIEWEKGLVLAYTPGSLNKYRAGVERLCLAHSTNMLTSAEKPEKEAGQRVMLLLGLVLLAEEQSYSDLVVYEDIVDGAACLIVEWRECPNRSWVQGTLFE